MKKILFVTSQLLIGGTETALYETVKVLNSPDTEITVVVMKSDGELYKDFQEICTVKDISDQYSRALITSATLKQNIKHLKLFSFVKNAILKFFEKYVYSHFKFKASIAKRMPTLEGEYDVAVAYSAPYTSMESFVINNVTAKRKLAWIHFDVSSYLKETDVSDFAQCYQKFDKIICVSAASQNTFIDRHPTLKDKTETVYNPIDVARIVALSKEDSRLSHSNNVTVCTVGRLSKDKGFDLAITAHKILKDKGYDIKWYVCGDGDYKNEIATMITNYGLGNEFILFGNQKNPYKYMNIADIYVQTSLTESYCITLAEARVLNKPIVTTCIPTASEHVTDGYNGFITDMTPEAIADAIEKLILSPELRKKFSENTKAVDGDCAKLKALFE